MKKKQIIRYVILAVLLLFIVIIRFSPPMGEWYAVFIYPYISMILSAFSSLFPFSVGDLFIFLGIAGLIVYPFYAWKRKFAWRHILGREIEFLLWIYVWFYFAWGLNYFRKDFYARTGKTRIEYTPEVFHVFLKKYVNHLNDSYVPIIYIDRSKVWEEAYKGYLTINEQYGLVNPRGYQRAKTMLFTPAMSMVGIFGYMGPFFSEFNLNGDIPPSQYPATYMHEFAHLLGITSEAEANLYAFLVCTCSHDPKIRFSGYFSLFPHVWSNAQKLLPEEECREFLQAVRPQILQLYEDNRAYWQSKYNPSIGKIQDYIYDKFLKSNNISTGKKNYSEVIGLLISCNLS